MNHVKTDEGIFLKRARRQDRELANEWARASELRNLHETAVAEVKRTNTQLERLAPSLIGAKRRVHDLENDASAAAATLDVLELKLVSEQENLRTADLMRAQEKTLYEMAALMLQIEALEGRQEVTTRLFEQTRALLNEKIDELRGVDRATKDLLAEKVVLERRNSSAQAEIRRLMDDGNELGRRHSDLQERCRC